MLLKKQRILGLYAYLWQGERSIQKVLGGSWKGFLEFYQQESIIPPQKMIDFLRSELDGNPRSYKKVKILINRQLGKSNFLKKLFRTVLYWRYKGIFLNQNELFFIIEALEQLKGILQMEEAPENEYLVPIRLSLCGCVLLIRSKCAFFSPVKKIRPVTHFYETEHLGCVSIEEIAGKNWLNG